MNRAAFNVLVREPAQLEAGQINDLQELASTYPYFSTIYILLTKAFKEEDNFNFESQLRKTAAYMADRQHLHQLLYALPAAKTKSKEPEFAVDANTAVPTLHNAEEQTNSATTTELPVAETEDTREEEKEMNPLEQQILTEAINSSILQEVSQMKEDQELSEFTALSDSKTSSQQQTDLPDPTTPSPTFDTNSPHGFSEWIRYFSGTSDPSSGSPPPAAAKQALADVSSAAKQIQQKAEFYSAAKMARRSVVENDDLVTETLAQIYERQGSDEKALATYQKLQLKFPEKKIYFAGRIRDIENRLKNK
jgi:hypothetical protein